MNENATGKGNKVNHKREKLNPSQFAKSYNLGRLLLALLLLLLFIFIFLIK